MDNSRRWAWRIDIDESDSKRQQHDSENGEWEGSSTLSGPRTHECHVATIRKLRLTFSLWNPATENPKTSPGKYTCFINPAFFTIDVVHVCIGT